MPQKLFKGGNYSQKYSINKITFFLNSFHIWFQAGILTIMISCWNSFHFFFIFMWYLIPGQGFKSIFFFISLHIWFQAGVLSKVFHEFPNIEICLLMSCLILLLHKRWWYFLTIDDFHFVTVHRYPLNHSVQDCPSPAPLKVS